MATFIPFVSCLFVFSQIQTTSSATTQTLSLASSCNNLADGIHYIRPRSDGEIIPAVCDNGYTIINLALDFDGISSYFTSFYETHWEENGVFSPDCVTGQGSSWRDWFIPATSKTNFRISKDCTNCKSSLSYGDNTAYYLTNYYFCNNKHHTNACEYTQDELLTMNNLEYNVIDDSISMCNICDDDSDVIDGDIQINDDGDWLDCISLQLSADVETDDNHDNCQMRDALIVKPSISNDGNFCTCYQTPDENEEEGEGEAVEAAEAAKAEGIETVDVDTASLPIISKSMYDKYKEKGIYIHPAIRVEEDSADSDITSHNKEASEESCSKKNLLFK